MAVVVAATLLVEHWKQVEAVAKDVFHAVTDAVSTAFELDQVPLAAAGGDPDRADRRRHALHRRPLEADLVRCRVDAQLCRVVLQGTPGPDRVGAGQSRLDDVQRRRPRHRVADQRDHVDDRLCRQRHGRHRVEDRRVHRPVPREGRTAVGERGTGDPRPAHRRGHREGDAVRPRGGRVGGAAPCRSRDRVIRHQAAAVRGRPGAEVRSPSRSRQAAAGPAWTNCSCNGSRTTSGSQAATRGFSTRRVSFI